MNSVGDAVFIVVVTLLGWFAGVASIETMIVEKMKYEEPMKLLFYSEKVNIKEDN